MDYIFLYLLLLVRPIEFEKQIPEPKASTLIKQLGANDFFVREKAQEQLKAAGFSVQLQLKIAAQFSTDPEVKRRIKILLEQLYSLPEIKEIQPLNNLISPKTIAFDNYIKEHNLQESEITPKQREEFHKKYNPSKQYLRRLIIHWYLCKASENKPLSFGYNTYQYATYLLYKDLRKLGITHKSIEDLNKWMKERMYSYIPPPPTWMQIYWNVKGL